MTRVDPLEHEPRVAAMTRELVERAIEKAARESLEFRTFCLGLHLEDEGLLRSGWLEAVSSAVKRRAGTALCAEWPGREVDLLAPEAMIIFDPEGRTLEVRLKSIYLYGRYRKLVRGLPQTRWHCSACHGRGCSRCKGKGREKEGSVEEALGEPVARAFRTSSVPLLHGMGREDADVLMLGSGRPFVLEVLQPRQRTVDLVPISVSGAVELASPLRFVDGEAVSRLKALDPPKAYRALCRAESEIDPARVATLAASLGEIKQRTPGRVKKSRADLVRTRRVLGLSARLVGPRELELEVRTESGTYVKELVSGDEGRTSPSVASLLGCEISVTELTVLAIEIEDEAVLAAYAKPNPGTSGPTLGGPTLGGPTGGAFGP
jgi:tRNA pseudouridine synthase 10